MKLIISIVKTDDSQKLIDKLITRGLKATKLASSGGFLKQSNTTLVLGVEDEQVDGVLDTIRTVCHEKEVLVPQITPSTVFSPSTPTPPVEATKSGATVFVVDVEEYQE